MPVDIEILFNHPFKNIYLGTNDMKSFHAVIFFVVLPHYKKMTLTTGLSHGLINQGGNE